ncbi:serine/threonine-protein kinase [Actinomadura luteofluorescens]|uniref:non-specific serine/threonine protein kinase n=2 Tax=Actinomadura luteofluorescens TaxID=46163 RepID=A0A7Y9JJR3_9ACTN|nr:cellulose binding domain-containing protein [Actinomadura luteofluorescens]NYD50903.1 serine/threonine-protein kinase [Actinomadura luteofluorescens]
MPEIIAPGERLGGRYRIERPLGAGGMATVWRAVDTVLDRAVAVKVPKDGGPEEFSRRLRQEAQAAAALTHPGITGVYDYGEHRVGRNEAPRRESRRIPYVVMELLDGESLAVRLSRGPLPWREAAGICARVADALAAAHDAGIVHRDIKPGNVYLTPAEVKVLDFGIAFTGTAGGPVMGTPAYMAPELVSGTSPTPAADVYSLGVVLHECLTGAPPTPSSSFRKGTPDEVAALCRDCLSPDPGARPTAAEAARLLAGASGVQLHAPGAAAPAGLPPQDRPRNPTRVLDDPGPARRGPGRPLLIAGVAAGALTALAALLAALAPGSSDQAGARPPATSPTAGRTTAAPSACSVSYRVDGTWPRGFQATVRITNLGDGAIDGWTLGFAFPDGQAITQLWNGSRAQDGASVTVTAAEWNRSIPAHGTAEFGFLGSQDGANGAPSRFTLNGAECWP